MAYECVYCATVGVIKISILLMYSRIFPTREFRIAAYILGIIVVSWVIAINFVSVFQCVPIEKTWNPTMLGHCIDLKVSFIGNAVPNILTDIAILSLPTRVVWKLHATLTHRLSVIVVFLLGSLCVFLIMGFDWIVLIFIVAVWSLLVPTASRHYFFSRQLIYHVNILYARAYDLTEPLECLSLFSIY